MKLIASRTALLSACQIAAGAVPSRDVKPVLRNVKIVASRAGGKASDGDACELMATDLEVGVRVTASGVRVESPGSILIHASRLTSILRESTDDELTIDGDGSDVTVIRSGSAEFKAPGEDVSAFPDVPSFDGTASCVAEIPASVIREMIRRTAFACGVDARFSAMSGVLWEVEAKTLTLVGTDSRRLAMSTKPCVVSRNKGIDADKLTSAVVPLKAMSLLERSLADADPDDAVRIAIRPNDILVATQRSTIYSRLVDGRFPTYRNFIPKPADRKVRASFAVGPFYGAVRQAAIMTGDENTRVAFGFAKSKLTLRASGSTSGQSLVETPLATLDGVNGAPFEILFNPKYVADMLRILDADASVVLDMTTAKNPAVFRCGDGDECVYVLVPLVNGAA